MAKIRYYGSKDAGYSVEVDGRTVGYTERDSVAESDGRGGARERYGWAAIPERLVAVADPVRNAGCPIFDTRREAAEWLANGGVL